MRPFYLAAVLWGMAVGATSDLAALRLWAAVVPLAIGLIVGPVLWAANELANRLEHLDPNEGPRYTGRRR